MNYSSQASFFGDQDSETYLYSKPSSKDLRLKGFYKDKSVKSNSKESRTFYPIPKGDSPYALAKKAEYIEKDLFKAEMYYKQAIIEGDRAESAIKDLAGVIHQQGKTLEAIQILKENKHLFDSDPIKYENLLQNLKRQVVQKGNRLNKLLKLSPLPLEATIDTVLGLFSNAKRITDVELYNEGSHIYAILKFSTHSAARKTLENFAGWEKFKVEWFSITGDNAGSANHKRGESRKDRVLFVYKVFHRDPESRALVLPLESTPVLAEIQVNESQSKLLIGTSLFDTLE